MATKKIRLLHPDHIPLRLPLIPTLFWWMFLDYVNAPGWVWGVMGVLLVFAWFVWGYQKLHTEWVKLP